MKELRLRVRRHAVDLELGLDLARPQVTALFGPSGAGKTTVLRVLAGLEPSGGHVRYGDQVWDDGNTIVPAQRRQVGFVLQDSVLFPHLDVAHNVQHGLRALPRRQRRDRALEALALVGASELATRRVQGLSGGEGQRVALARALAPRPRVLLLDEPLSALDAPTRAVLRQDLRHVLARAGVPTVLVTHERAEVLALADSVALMRDGRLLQVGSPQEVFGRPASPEAAAAVGTETVELGVASGRTDDGFVVVRLGGHELVGTASGTPPVAGSAAMVCIRAEDVHLRTGSVIGAGSARNQLPGTVARLQDEGALVRVEVDCGFRLTALVTRRSAEDLELSPGRAVTASVKASHAHLVAR